MCSQRIPPADEPYATSLAAPIYLQYSALCRTLELDAETGLGGRLLYAGEMTAAGRILLYAANIAGAASLAASADPAVQRLAMRDGVVDFVVTSLEEALRILKNEVRKRQTVSVGVGVEPGRLLEAMIERGVLPDLLPPIAMGVPQMERFIANGALSTQPSAADKGRFVNWSVDRQFAQGLPRLDACVLGVIPEEDVVRRRWVRLAPRYLGRMAQRERGVVLTADELDRFRAAAGENVAGQTEALGVEIAGEPLL